MSYNFAHTPNPRPLETFLSDLAHFGKVEASLVYNNGVKGSRLLGAEFVVTPTED